MTSGEGVLASIPLCLKNIKTTAFDVFLWISDIMLLSLFSLYFLQSFNYINGPHQADRLRSFKSRFDVEDQQYVRKSWGYPSVR